LIHYLTLFIELLIIFLIHQTEIIIN